MRLAVEAHEVDAVGGELALEVLERLEEKAQAVVAAVGETGRFAVEYEDGYEALDLVHARQQRRVVVQAQSVAKPVYARFRHCLSVLYETRIRLRCRYLSMLMCV